MKAALVGGALAFALWGGAALAGEGDSMSKNCPQGEQSSLATGGSGDAMSADCPDTLAEDSATGEAFTTEDSAALGGSSTEGQMTAEPETEETNIVAVQPMEDYEEEEDRTKNDARGVTVLLGGGVEGYTGDLAPDINPGPGWGVGVALKPVGAVGLELGYSGAINSITGSSGLAQDPDNAQDVRDEADIVRHGGSAVATLGLGAAEFQPYVLGGVGIDRYNVRNAGGNGFRDDTVGNVPLGLGFRTHLGDFTADLRGVYDVLFNQGFAPAEGNTDLGDIGSQTPTGRFTAQLRLGATF